MERKKFTQELKDRFLAPWTSIFVGYLCILVIAGGVSILATFLDIRNSGKLLDENYKIAESLGTFFIALIATSFIDLNFCTKLQNKKSFMMWSYVLVVVLLFLFWGTYQFKNWLSFFPSVLGTLLALVTWVIANADNENIIKEDNFFDEMRGKDNHGQNW